MGQKATDKEITSEDTQPGFTIHMRTNIVLVRVVVRDREGKPVPNLTKNDFRLLDNGKAQTVSQFTVEREEAPAPTAKNVLSGAQAAERPAAPAPPKRFVAFYFDDTYMSFEDIARTRDAATRYLNQSLQHGDRVGIYTSSGDVNVDFTNDRDKLDAGLDRLSPHPLVSEQSAGREQISDYEAYLIAVREDKNALTLATAQLERIVCGDAVLPAAAPAGANVNPCGRNLVERVKSEARQIWERTRFEVDRSMQGLLELIRRMSVMPGQRIIVWVSPGFLGMDQNYQFTSLTEVALRAAVVINTLDSRGLWTDVPGGQASEAGPLITGSVPAIKDPATGQSIGGTVASGSQAALQGSWNLAARETSSAVLEDAAAATGGVFVHDTNDYDGAFRRAGGLPEAAYLLSFSPKDLKYDGKYHKLSVELTNVDAHHLTLQARKGYFAPTEAPNAENEATTEVENEVFANEDRSDLPLGLQTQFFMTSETDGQLSVIARVDLHGAALRKENQLNADKLHFVTALFDDNGNFLEGRSRIIHLRLKETTFAKLMGGSGAIQTGWRFNVKPGIYVIREVVRDNGNGGIAALSRTVQIP
jgi:VWFA-related protein